MSAEYKLHATKAASVDSLVARIDPWSELRGGGQILKGADEPVASAPAVPLLDKNVTFELNS